MTRQSSAHSHMHPHHGETATLDPLVQKNVDLFLSWIIDIEKKHYKSDLQPFSMHVEQMKAKAYEYYLHLTQQLEHAQQLLKKQFELEESKKPGAFPESSFALWEEAAAALREKLKDEHFSAATLVSLQDQMSLPWAWMDRAYHVANDLLSQSQYKDAGDIYFFLCQLQPAVFDYWLGQATCEHVLGDFRKAIDTYSMCLLFQPESAVTFFQMADCYLRLGEKENSSKCIQYCLELIEQNPGQSSLKDDALQLKQAIELQK